MKASWHSMSKIAGLSFSRDPKGSEPRVGAAVGSYSTVPPVAPTSAPFSATTLVLAELSGFAAVAKA